MPSFFLLIRQPHEIITYEYPRIEEGIVKHFEGRIIFLEENKVLRFVRDISENKKKESEIRKLNLAIEQSPVAIVITDLEANVLYVSPAFTNITGYSVKEIIGLNTRLLSSGRTPRELYREMWDTIRQGKIWMGEWLNKKKNGELYWEKASISPIFDDFGHIVNYLAVKSDISGEKQAEEDRIAREAAEAANKAKSAFLANISHEIRTPMNAVLGYSDILDSVITDKTQKEYIASIKSSGKSLLTIINDVLDISKIEAGKLELEYNYVPTNAFFNDINLIFTPKIESKSVEFKLDILKDIPQGLYIDEARLRQVLINLIGNAVKFTEKGYIKLKVETRNPQLIRYNDNKTENFIDLIIEVEDTGIGISSELQATIFDEFTQAEGSKRTGTGLGLSIARRLIKLMNGKLELKSVIDVGSTFTIYLPDIAFLSEYQSGEQEDLINIKNINFKDSKVLVVDDIEYNRKFLVDALKDTNITVYEAVNGLEGINEAEKIRPDLIIADIRMPVMDGFEMLTNIKKRPSISQIPVIAYSASVMKEQKIRIFECGFIDLLSKPLGMSQLFNELMKYLPHKVDREVEGTPTDGIEIIENITNIDELLDLLTNNYYAKWQSFEKRQPIGEIREFGVLIKELGMNYNAKTVMKYGEEMITSADNFNIEKILELLAKYDKLIESIKQNK